MKKKLKKNILSGIGSETLELFLKIEVGDILFMMCVQYLAFVCGSVLAVLIGLTVWDEDVLNVEHVLTIITVLGATVAGARVFIPGGWGSSCT